MKWFGCSGNKTSLGTYNTAKEAGDAYDKHITSDGLAHMTNADIKIRTNKGRVYEY